MNLSNSHALVVDYREDILKQFKNCLENKNISTHIFTNRLDALSRLWEMVDKKVYPRAIITNWLLNDPEAREFYSLIHREVDHTSLNLVKNAAKMDIDNKTIIICYTDRPGETQKQLAHLDLLDQIAVLDSDEHSVDDVVRILLRDERSRILDEYAQNKKDTRYLKKYMTKEDLLTGI